MSGIQFLDEATMNSIDFIDLVAKMRETQKTYFKSRTQSNLLGWMPRTWKNRWILPFGIQHSSGSMESNSRS